MENLNPNIDQQIEAVLEKIRYFLQREGGDIEYIGFKDGVVYVKMIGACEGCAYVSQDISTGVEMVLIEEVPGVIRCVNADKNVPVEVMEQYFQRKLKENEGK